MRKLTKFNEQSLESNILEVAAGIPSDNLCDVWSDGDDRYVEQCRKAVQTR